MDNSDGGYGGAANNSAAVELTGKIMVVAIIVLFLVVVFVLFLHLYAKWFWWRVEEATVPSREARNPRRRRFVFVSGQDPSAAASVRTGLDPSVLRSLPVLIFNPEDFKEGLECAVCLSDLAPAEKARLLPKCNHGFHVECIDMWLQSHSTCPICRNPVAPPPPHCSIPIGVDSGDSDLNSAGEDSTLHSVEESSNSDSNLSNELLNFPTNVLFWGNDTQVSSRGAGLEDGPSSQSNRPSSSIASTNLRPDGMLVIDIPRQAGESSSPEEELKSPITTRLRSLKRLLSKEKRVAPCSSSCVEAEQLGRSQNS